MTNTPTGDTRVDNIMPPLCEEWMTIPFDDAVLPHGIIPKKLKTKEMSKKGKIPIIDQGEQFISGYTDNEKYIYQGNSPLIIFGDHTRRIKYIDFPFAVGADGTKLLHPIAAIEPKLFYYYLNSLKLVSEGYSRHYKFLREVSVPIPPLNEQRRIVAKLEKLLERVNDCQKRLDKIPVLLKRFRQSVLSAACSGRLTENWRKTNSKIEPAERLGEGEPPEDYDLPPTWNWLLSACAFDFVTSGSRGWAKYYSDKGAVFIRVGNLNHDSIQLDLKSIQHVLPPKNAEGIRTRVQAGDILISITADVGMVALIDKPVEESYINQHVALARPLDIINKRYLAYYLCAKNGGQQQFLNLQRGATKVGLGLDDIRSIWITRPPMPEQEEIVSQIEKLFALADKLEARYSKAKAQVDKLTQSILAKAFRGDGVHRDPHDEPASALLKRIKGESKSKPVPNTRRKTNA